MFSVWMRWARGLLLAAAVTMVGPAAAQIAAEADALNAEVVRLQQAGKYAEALDLQRTVTQRIEKVETTEAGMPGEKTATALSNLAWIALLARGFPEALATSERAHRLAPDQLVVETNRAHALLFLGRTQEARALYLAHKGETIPDAGKETLWGDVIEEDFAALRVAGMAHPAFDEIMTVLGIDTAISKQQIDALKAQVRQLHDAGHYTEAVPVAQQYLQSAHRRYGEKGLPVAIAASWLAGLYNELARYPEAESLYKRSLAINENALGPDHRDVATSLNNLGALYQGQGRAAEAETLYKRSLAIREKALGPKHPDVATSLNNLAVLYENQGRYPEAETLHKRSLTINEKALGPDHRDVARSLNNLAGLYLAQGRYAEAEPLYKRSLAIREKVQGPEHPDVAGSLNNLASLYVRQGRYPEAEPLFKRSLATNEKVLGAENPSVATVLNNLSELYRTQGRYAEAETLSKRSLAITEKAQGPEHLGVGLSLNNLALLYYAQGRYAEAESFNKRALAIYEKALGPEHPDVSTSLNNLAVLYRDQGRYVEAEPIYKRSLAIAQKALGAKHPDVATTLNELATLYRLWGRYGEAELLFKRSLDIREKALGAEHPDVSRSLNNLAALYRDQGRYAESEQLYKRSLAIHEKTLGPEHPDVATVLNNLSDLYRTQGRYAEAETLSKRSLAIGERALGHEHPSVAVTLHNLGLLYEKLGRTDEAAQIRARAAAIPSWEVADVLVHFATNRASSISNGTAAFGETQIIDLTKAALGRVVMRAPRSEVLNRAARGAEALGRLHKAGGRQTTEATLTIQRIEVASDNGKAQFADARERLTRAARFPRQALVYIHGYNSSFDDAVRRAAMIAFDLDFDGMVAAFAWPSRSGMSAYLGDRERAQTAAPFLVQMLESLGAALPDVTVHLVSHSTGAEVVLSALEKLADRSVAGPRVRLGEVIFAHADVNATRLAQVMPSLSALKVRLTSYSSKEDLAMRASDILRMDGARVGGAPVHIPGVDSIDITGLGTFFALNHSVFVTNPLVFGDMARLMATGERPPSKRTPYFTDVVSGKGTHWEYRAPR